MPIDTSDPSDLVELPDSETRASDDHHQALRLWLRLLATSNLVENRIRQLLQSNFATTLPRFDLMAQLERTPQGLQMGELSQRLMVTGGNVTGVTNMLAAEGLVARAADPADRRVFRVKLTDKGRKQFKRMAIEHEKWIVEMFEGLSSKRMDQLADLLRILKTRTARQIRRSPL